ncbi:uncharacterized protein LOC135468995 [Liolophura sinensis]|uniref:uncharacterized protein LOC135468995 n=1 Tax=Liolophura sinensis TaxID=3198878 RepID=UPI0031583A49
MAAPHELRFDDNFVDLPAFSSHPGEEVKLENAPKDPLYDLIDSDRYIKSLENKLRKLKGGSKKEPTAKDMISSLEKSKEDHFRRLEQFKEDYVSNFVSDSLTSDNDSSLSYIQRRIHPDRIAIDPEELMELLQDNAVEKQVEKSQMDNSDQSIPGNNEIPAANVLSNVTGRGELSSQLEEMKPQASEKSSSDQAD